MMAEEYTRVLVVEDDEEWRQILCDTVLAAVPPSAVDMAVSSKLDVESAESYDAAAEVLRSRRFSLAIFDVRLDANPHDAGGLALLDVVAQVAPEMGVILLSGWSWIERLSLPENVYPNVRVLDKLSKTHWNQHQFIGLVRHELGLGDLATPSIEKKVEPQPSLTERQRPNGFQVLIVEDDSEWVEVLTEVLTEAGYAVVHAATRAEALPWLYRKRPVLDAALLDFSLVPGDQNNREGRELLDDLQKVQLPTVVLSGYASQNQLADALQKYSVVSWVFQKKTTRSIQKGKYRRQDVLDAVRDAVETSARGKKLALLTRRQMSIVTAIRNGYTSPKTIADHLALAAGYISNSIRLIERKLGVDGIPGIMAFVNDLPVPPTA